MKSRLLPHSHRSLKKITRGRAARKRLPGWRGDFIAESEVHPCEQIPAAYRSQYFDSRVTRGPRSSLRTPYRILNAGGRNWVTHRIQFTKRKCRNDGQRVGHIFGLQFHKLENRLGGAYKILLHITISYRLICTGLLLGLGRCGSRRRRGRARNILGWCWFVDVLVSRSRRGETSRHAPDCRNAR